MKFQEISLKNEINDEIEKYLQDNTMFIFPTKTSCNSVIKKYSHKWNLNRITWITMDELKQNLFISNYPILKEDKRLLAFYQSLSDEDRFQFNIHDYFQSVELAYNFFSLFEELNEENIANENVKEILLNENENNDWQVLTFERLIELRQQYFDFITKKKFSDKIFLNKISNFNLTFTRDFENIIIVNQFYFSETEKQLISIFEKQKKSVTLLHQFPEKIINKESLNCNEIEAIQFTENLLEEIEIFETPNQTSQIISCLEEIKKKKHSNILDFRFSEQVYSNLLSSDIFGNQSILFIHSPIYKFLKNILELIESIKWNDMAEHYTLSLQAFFNALYSDNFIKFFYNENFNDASIDNLKKTVQILIEKDYKFLDLDGKFFAWNTCPEDSEEIFTEISDFLKRFLGFNTLEDLLENGICDKNFLDFDKFLDEKYSKLSNIMEVFYEGVIDLLTIKKLDLVTDWHHIFETNNHIKYIENLLNLFLEYIKVKNIEFKYDTSIEVKQKVNIFSLQDTRNLSYQEISILNLTEGVLPASPKTPYLFNEKQRAELGLKTYEDIRNRDKYYFFRLISNSKKVKLFTCNNLEKNIEISSFIEEILLDFPKNIIKYHKIPDLSLKHSYSKFFKPDEDFLSKNSNKKNDSFFTIPFDCAIDFPDNELNLSYYKYKNWKKNPFNFYLKNIMKFENIKTEIQEKYSNKLLGNIIHTLLNNIWDRLIQTYQGNEIHHNFSHVTINYIERAILNLFSTDRNLYYQTPQNYAQIYFQEIIIPLLMDGVKSFFMLLHEKYKFSDTLILAIPETKRNRKKSYEKKILIHSQDIENKLQINITGEADLRIEINKPHSERMFIFDYKTGKFDKEQLLFYELFYYLIDNPEKSKDVESVFYEVLNKENKSLSELYKIGNRDESSERIEIIAEFKANIVAMIDNLFSFGFAITPEKDIYDDQNISRKDLLSI